MDLEWTISLLTQLGAIALSAFTIAALYYLLGSKDADNVRSLSLAREVRRGAARDRAAALEQVDVAQAPLLKTAPWNTDLYLKMHTKTRRSITPALRPMYLQTTGAGRTSAQKQPLGKPQNMAGDRGEVEMKTLIERSHGSPDRFEIVGRRMLWVSWVGLALFALMLTACNTPAAIPDTPTATEPVLNSGVLEGTIWQDQCLNVGLDQETPPGCVENLARGQFIGNGTMENGEAGIEGAKVKLGIGACPSQGLAEVTTDENGMYAFIDLLPSRYCVSAEIGENHTQSAVVPGIWTNPASGMQEIGLGLGEHRGGVNFGWDIIEEPVPPTATPTPTSTPVPEQVCSDEAGFIKDVTISDGTRLDPGETFRKTWRLRNEGTCTWKDGYDLIFISGEIMGGDYVVPLRGSISPDQLIDLSVNLKAPTSYGSHAGYWMLRNDRGQIFGVDKGAKSPFWVRIFVEPEIDEWRGEYFDNMELKGDPDLIRDDDEIDFNWEHKAPARGLPSNEFSARWTRRLKFEESPYRFSVRVDDGARLWVDDRLVIDAWETGSDRTLSIDLWMSKGKHDIRLEFFEKGGQARIHLVMKKTSFNPEGSWLGTYWYNRTLDSKWALVETSEAIAFDWGTRSPGQGLPKNNFSARWVRDVDFEPGVYRFKARADDGIRVAVDGDLIINEWHTGSANETYPAVLELSGRHRLTVEYFEKTGKAQVYFDWERQGALNNPPTAVEDVFEMMEGDTLVLPAPGILQNDRDLDGDSLTAKVVEEPRNGTLVLDSSGAFVYQPEVGFAGQDSFKYLATDGKAESSPAAVTIHVSSLNTAPTAEDDAFEVAEDSLLTVAAPGLLENDSDPDGQQLEIILLEAPEFGELKPGPAGGFEYMPAADFHGEDSFTYRLSDGELESEPARVTITIQPVNDVPQASDDEVRAPISAMVEIEVLTNDRGLGDEPIVLAIEIPPEFGSVEVRGNAILYTPLEGWPGEDRLTYSITDVDGERSQASVILIGAAEGG